MIHPPAAVALDAEFLATVCNHNTSSLRRTDTPLDLLKDHLNVVSMGLLVRSHADSPNKNSDVAVAADSLGQLVCTSVAHIPF
jgi:hypothetical protein